MKRFFAIAVAALSMFLFLGCGDVQYDSSTDGVNTSETETGEDDHAHDEDAAHEDDHSEDDHSDANDG